jgi:hypothetical protein
MNPWVMGDYSYTLRVMSRNRMHRLDFATLIGVHRRSSAAQLPFLGSSTIRHLHRCGAVAQ